MNAPGDLIVRRDYVSLAKETGIVRFVIVPMLCVAVNARAESKTIFDASIKRFRTVNLSDETEWSLDA